MVIFFDVGEEMKYLVSIILVLFCVPIFSAPVLLDNHPFDRAITNDSLQSIAVLFSSPDGISEVFFELNSEIIPLSDERVMLDDSSFVFTPDVPFFHREDVSYRFFLRDTIGIGFSDTLTASFVVNLRSPFARNPYPPGSSWVSDTGVVVSVEVIDGLMLDKPPPPPRPLIDSMSLRLCVNDSVFSPDSPLASWDGLHFSVCLPETFLYSGETLFVSLTDARDNPDYGEPHTLEETLSWQLFVGKPFAVHIRRGWGIYSCPGVVSSCFIDTSFMFRIGFDTGRRLFFYADSFPSGFGFWGLSLEGKTDTLFFVPDDTVTFHLLPGWNLVGAPGFELDIEDIFSLSPSLVPPAYEYISGVGYIELAGPLQPFGGFWLFSLDTVSLEVSE